MAVFAAPVTEKAVAAPVVERAARTGDPKPRGAERKPVDGSPVASRVGAAWNFATIAAAAPEPPHAPEAPSAPAGVLRASAVSHELPGSAARIHTDAAAARGVRALGALAATIGRDVYFGAGQYAPQTAAGAALLRHELAHVAQARDAVRPERAHAWRLATPEHPAEREASRIADAGGHPAYRTGLPLVFRQSAPSPVARHTAAEIFGQPAAVPPVPGMTLAEFKSYARAQADWFIEPSIAAGTNRNDLWQLLLVASEGPHMLTGVGDIQISALRGVSAADWTPLRAFCRGTHASGHTVRIFAPLPPLADRIALGRTLVGLETIISPAVLELTVSHTQLLEVQAGNLLPLLTTYWRDYEPHLEQKFTAAPAARGPEFDRVLTFLNALGVPGLAPLEPLRGASPAERWVRDLHRFSLPMLQRLVANLGDTTGAKRLVLVLHSGYDAAGAFQGRAATIFGDLVLTSPNNLVLMIEGPTSIADITSRIPGITSTWGEIVAGTRRISQVVIAGHGSAQTVAMAGTAAPAVAGGAVEYPHESLRAGQATTQALLDALLTHMPAATARILYAGCLVGSTDVAAGTPAANIPGALAAQQSLGAFTEARAAAAGIPAGRVQAARASVAMGQATSLTNAAGDLALQYPFDPNVFGTATAYAQSGREPEGVLRAAVEVGAVSTVTAETLLRTRLAMAATNDWYDTTTRLLVGLALPAPAVPPAGVNLQRVNELANIAELPFLAFWPGFNWITPHGFSARLNPQPFALDVYNGVAATTAYQAPTTPPHTERLRIVVDQGWLALSGAAHVPALMAGIVATNLFANAFEEFLDPAILAPQGAALLPLGAPPTVGQIRLALAWFSRQSANVDVRNFLSAQVTHPAGAPPAFTPAVTTAISDAGRTDREILDALGFGPAAMNAPVGGGAALPLSNLAVAASATNTLLAEGRAYDAQVTAANAPVFPGPSIAGARITTYHAGRTVHVAGRYFGWAVVDTGGRVGYISTSDLTAPPP